MEGKTQDAGSKQENLKPPHTLLEQCCLPHSDSLCYAKCVCVWGGTPFSLCLHHLDFTNGPDAAHVDHRDSDGRAHRLGSLKMMENIVHVSLCELKSQLVTW